MENKIKLSIILVNWNCGQTISDCLESLYVHIKDINYEIIVVDNNSTDGSREYIEKHFPQVVLIKNDFNNLFAGANNQGYQIARGEYIWILNSDTRLFENSIEKMIGFLDDPKIGAVTCKLLNQDGSTQYYMHRKFPTYIRMVLSFVHRGFRFFKPPAIQGYLYLRNDFQKNFYIEQPAGVCILMKREVIEKVVGLFDEKNFSLFFNDVDVSYRLHIFGYLILCVCNTSIFHSKGQSTNKLGFFANKYYYIPSALLFFKKHNLYKDFYLSKISYTILFIIIGLHSSLLFLTGFINFNVYKERILLVKTIIQTGY